MNKKGLIGLIVLIIVLIAVSAWWFFSHYDFGESGGGSSEELNDEETIGKIIVCTEEARVCDDGIVVVRNASLDCEFDACLVVESEIIEIDD